MVRNSFFIVALLLNTTIRFAYGLPDPYPRDWNVDVIHYSFQISLSDNSDRIEGQAQVDISFLENVNEVFLDLVNVNAEGKGMTIASVHLNGNEVDFEHTDNRLKITPEQSFQKKSNATLTVEYAGIPQNGLVIAKNKFGERTFFGDNWPDRARHWLPTVDHPSDKASVDWIVTAPVKYQVVGNGELIEHSNTEEGLKRTHWRETVDISTKVMVIGASRFAVGLSGYLRNIPIQAWVYPQNREEGFSDYAPAVGILHFYDSLIGPYSYKKLANVQSKTMFGGMENASNIFYYENSVTGNGNIDELIAHEVAHQWFGNSASEKDWHHVWLSEGFATYFTQVYVENFKGIDAFQSSLQNTRKRVISYYDKNPVPVVNTAITNNMRLLNANSYQKGGWVLHMLRNKVGDENFFTGIRNYYNKFQNSNAMTEDLKNVMESVSGMELDDFFQQWIFTAGQPEIDVSWSYDSKKKEVHLDVAQSQEKVFTFPLEFGIDNEVYTAKVSKSRESFTFRIVGTPDEIVLDPGTKLLYRGTIRKN